MEMINTYDEGDVDYSVVSVVWLTIDLMYVELSSLYFFQSEGRFIGDNRL